MNRYRLTQAGGRTFIEKLVPLDAPITPFAARPFDAFLTVYGERVFDQGTGNHRKQYSDEDAMAVVRWLNDRENGYLSMNYLALRWAVDDNKVSPERRR